ncbi:ABC transporter ATP-binding protein [Anaerosacchariphilus polymeriproducens]|uniref:ATP-binding cassette domain-containing protein n=1 Tax=Anaerosacchariphilus polymeriproducens TaxID=1812858 RepID=A0A371AUJ3_9FIRM|nr:ABC transporter ATP-binding protein [Anaerosacchariphilus polymeriproducens]RDU23212.1 ATP-binding cassette domain-containing protein [Anaerosacchariphilus polymeriproducens]
MSNSINIGNVVKKYGELTIIPNLSVQIKNGEFFTLLGPSGCGKTTLLRMIAGFNSIEGGEIKFDDMIINNISAHKRNIGMVFQNYAIFPHLTVRQNVEYGLKIRKIPKAEMKKKVDEILETVKISDYQDRLPEKLSGGQQQRVALARAIVIHPSVLLMDEPLSNLDAKLRVEMRSAIRDAQKKVGITTVYVTHDQEEALAISDRIAVMNQGVIQQVGTPEEIYARPNNVFVSTFIGHSNLFYGKVGRDSNSTYVEFTNGYKILLDNLSQDCKAGMKVIISVRPEEFSIANDGLKVKIKNRTFLGKHTNYELDFSDSMIIPNQPSIEYSQDLGQSTKTYEAGEMLSLKPNAYKINVFTEDGQKSLIKGCD